MPNLNYTNIYFSIAPRSYSGQSLNTGGNTYDVFGDWSKNRLISVNDPINIQVLWEATGLGQDQEGTGNSGERVPGDLVNVLFDIYEGPTKNDGSLTLADDFRKVCTVKKSKDVPYKYNGRPADEVVLTGHRFTIDIAPVLADLLSYSLVPPGMGTWGSNDTPGSTGPQNAGAYDVANMYGGMNGQWQMNYVASTTPSKNEYNLEANGTERLIEIRARFEILAANGTLVESTYPANRSCSNFTICNSAPQLGDKDMEDFIIDNYTNAEHRFLTNCPNRDSTGLKDQYFKEIYRYDDAEFLQWWQYKCANTSGTIANLCSEFAIKVEVSPVADFTTISDTVYMVDFCAGLRTNVEGNTTATYRHSALQKRMFTQNVSPAYINEHNNGGSARLWTTGYTSYPITSATPYYRCSVHLRWGAAQAYARPTGYYYYKANFTEDKGNWKNSMGMKNGVKFMWLNRMGGIDSYTATRDISNSVEVSQNTITKLTPYKRFPLNTTITGQSMSSRILSDMYPHKREALNVDANKNWTVYTDPLTVPESQWIEEIFTSPNVWMVQKTIRSESYADSPDSNIVRNSDYCYVPVLITNGSTTLVDEQNGLSQVRIDFTESNPINTQRN